MAGKKLDAAAKGALVLSAALTLIALLIANTAITIIVTPIVMLLVMFAMARMPLRVSILGLAFCSFTIDNPGEGFGGGYYESPLATVGAILLTNLNTVDRDITALSSLAFSGIDLAFGFLLIVGLYRRQTGSRIDAADQVPTPQPIVRLALLAFGAILFGVVWGMLRGGTFRWLLWQVRAAIYTPVLLALFHMGLRGAKDLPSIARVLTVAAVYRAGLAVYIQYTYKGSPEAIEAGETSLHFATSHQDSMLFATVLVMFLSLLMEKSGKKLKRWAMLIIPALVWGMIKNNRRIVWVHVGLALAVLFFVSKDNPIKKKLIRIALYTTPVAIIYVMVGWNREYSRLFKPVQTIRSVVDAKSDGSTLWRELENFDLIMTFRHNMLFGSGYGHPYIEYIELPAIPFDLERYLPHNSILGLLAYLGIVGFTGLTLSWAGGAYFALRVYHRTKNATHRTASLTCFVAILVFISQAWGDMGWGSFTGTFLATGAVVAASKLAVEAGQWPQKKRRRRRVNAARAAPDAAAPA